MSVKHYENNVSNTRGNRTLCIAGVFATESSGTYTGAAAYPGQLAVKSALYPSTAFAGKNNPNTWYMVAADDNTALADLYVASPDVPSKGVAAWGAYNLGQETLGVPQPAGEATRFQKLVEGDMVTFGDGWFATAPTTTNKYCTISSAGLWTPASTAPQSGVYFEILETVNFTAGCYDAGTGYYGIVRNA